MNDPTYILWILIEFMVSLICWEKPRKRPDGLVHRLWEGQHEDGNNSNPAGQWEYNPGNERSRGKSEINSCREPPNHINCQFITNSWVKNLSNETCKENKTGDSAESCLLNVTCQRRPSKYSLLFTYCTCHESGQVNQIQWKDWKFQGNPTQANPTQA